MNPYKNIFLVFVISFIVLVDHVLTVEGIRGGREAFKPDYKYQAAILTDHYTSLQFQLICNGVILSAYVILSAAHCFLDRAGGFKNLSFYVRAGSSDLKYDMGYRRLLQYIYIFNYIVRTDENDIAVSKTKTSFNLSPKLNWKPIRIAKPEDIADLTVGCVSGYGAQGIGVQLDFILRYAFVQIANSSQCRNKQGQPINTEAHICGIMKPDFQIPTKGLCNNDGGSPLVINETLVGLSTPNKPDCDDTVNGSIYTNLMLPYYRTEIDKLIRGWPSKIKIYKNVLYRL